MTGDHALVVVADGGGARAFVEKRRHGALCELSAFAPPPQTPRAHGRHGAHDFVRGAEDDERRLLTGVTKMINDAAVAGEYGRIVVMAPARALGIIREGLKAPALAIIELEEPRDRRGQSPDQIRAALKHLRLPA